MLNLLEKLAGPKGRKVSLFLAEVVSYAGLTALTINPKWLSCLTMVGFFVVLLIVLSPFTFHAVDVSKEGESGFLLSLRLTVVLALPILLSTAIKNEIASDVPRLIWMTAAFACTSALSRRCRRKLPGI
ncbi:hypothetical protein [Corynebacterium rhinophilum]|uniref:hypothetical protein n=1 Tax=Corynebacterium rhinophilum TaxID=3050197 RepID=UPI00254F1F07|nr:MULTISPECIES: hypothetical protein [unclassified Corynebacterium]MDK8646625.1 hypothetical protein [Corynebacterium sp. MSK082]MDK8699082.1 hypothetical protein [Corynebacterium sp. MSK192]